MHHECEQSRLRDNLHGDHLKCETGIQYKLGCLAQISLMLSVITKHSLSEIPTERFALLSFYVSFVFSLHDSEYKKKTVNVIQYVKAHKVKVIL